MDARDDIDLDDLTERLRAVRRQLETHADPARERLAALGPVGLFTVAADEQRLADQEPDRARRRVHVIAASAAQRLAEQLVAERLGA